MRLIDADKLYNWVKRECNPYGKPTIDFESGNRMLDMIKRSSTAFDKEKVINEIRSGVMAANDEYIETCDEYYHGMQEAHKIDWKIVEKGGIE